MHRRTTWSDEILLVCEACSRGTWRTLSCRKPLVMIAFGLLYLNGASVRLRYPSFAVASFAPRRVNLPPRLCRLLYGRKPGPLADRTFMLIRHWPQVQRAARRTGDTSRQTPCAPASKSPVCNSHREHQPQTLSSHTRHNSRTGFCRFAFF
jgi:hypothetical protein